MTANQTVIIFISLLLYFIVCGTILGFVQNDIPITTNGEEYSFCKNVLCTEKTFFGNFIANIDGLPLWFNGIFFGIPLAVLIIIGILLLLHG